MASASICPASQVPTSPVHSPTQELRIQVFPNWERFILHAPHVRPSSVPGWEEVCLGGDGGSGRPGSHLQCLTLNRPPSTPGSPRRLSGLGNRSLDFSWKCFEPPHFELGVRAPACPCRPRDGGRGARGQAPRSGQHGCDALPLLFQEQPPLPFLSAGFPNILCREGGKIYSGNYFLTVW